MKKEDKRKIMDAIADSDISDEKVLRFIKILAQNQLFKSPRAFENFCVDLAIFYTSSIFVLSRKMNENLTTDEIHSWSEKFIESASYFKILIR